MKKEEWKFVTGYEGLYMVSNWGRVKSMNYKNTGKEQILKPGKNQSGYLQVHLSKKVIKKIYAIHCLVWDAFGDRPRNGRILQVDHIDNNKENNCIENLQLLNCRDNTSKRSLNKYKTSTYSGVSIHKRSNNKWQAQININGKKKYLGIFNSEEEAKKAYQYALAHQDEIVNRKEKVKSSKYKGIHLCKRSKKWIAQLYVNGKQMRIGSYNTELEAYEAYLKAKENFEFFKKD